MKLTKIESFEIQAFAFRVMTGYMAPGKDSSPLADEAPYEERCAAWDEWRNKYAHCILAMLHGFEALIDRDDEPTGALLDRLRAAEAEVERLRHDIERHIAIASEHATECERLRAELSDAYAEVHKQVAVSKVIFDRALVNRAKASLATPSEERKP